MTKKELLNSVKLYLSPITKKCYLCFVKDNIIQEKNEIKEDELFNFLVGSAETLSQKYGEKFYIEDSRQRVDIKITLREK